MYGTRFICLACTYHTRCVGYTMECMERSAVHIHTNCNDWTRLQESGSADRTGERGVGGTNSSNDRDSVAADGNHDWQQRVASPRQATCRRSGDNIMVGIEGRTNNVTIESRR